jgi:hypothetical protein
VTMLMVMCLIPLPIIRSKNDPTFSFATYFITYADGSYFIAAAMW